MEFKFRKYFAFGLFIGSSLLPILYAAPVYMPIPNGIAPALGFGFSSDKSQTVERCLNAGIVVYSGSNTGLVDLGKETSLSSVKNYLHIGSEAKIGIGLFSGGAEFDFYKWVENDSLSETLIYRTNMTFKDSIWTYPESGPLLNPLGEQWVGTPQFRNVCGDKLIRGMHHSGDLFVALNFRFISHHDREKFDSSFKTSFGSFASLIAKFNSEVEHLNIAGSIHITAFQQGGDVQYLSQIFGKPDYNNPSPISECSFQNPVACSKVITNILNYTIDADSGFPSQLKVLPGQEYPANAAEYNYELADMTNYVKPETPSIVTPEILDYRTRLGSHFELALTDASRARFLTQQTVNPPFVYDDYRGKLSVLQRDLDFNETILQQAGIICFSNPEECVSQGDATIRALKPIDKTLLGLPSQFTVTQTGSPHGTQALLFVAKDTSTPRQTFYGVSTNPNNNYRQNIIVSFKFSGADIFMDARDNDSGNLVASYSGRNTGNGIYRGNVVYHAGDIVSGTGTFTAVLTKSAATMTTY